eukprot:gb/GECH01010843.1/.p1 GENE.gb/GECH01010843.1/~~gb/GECH01010843.1/.p1  ORF type:complete len:448 (+),score=108.01 gb/GECH01010843.1/:1-1344(+)
MKVQYVLAREQKRCTTRIQKQLTALAFGKVQALHKSLLPKVFGHAFQVLEFYGDAVLQERVSKYLITTRRFMNPCMLSQLRQSCVSNKNLCEVFEALQLETITVPDLGTNKSDIKAKGDIVEAIIGELILNKNSSNSLHPFIDAVLEELLSFICFIGEQRFFTLMDHNASSSDKPDAASSNPTNYNQQGKVKSKKKKKQQKKPQKKSNNTSSKSVEQETDSKSNPTNHIDTPSINNALQPLSSSSKSTSTSKTTAVQKSMKTALKTNNNKQSNNVKQTSVKVRFQDPPENQNTNSKVKQVSSHEKIALQKEKKTKLNTEPSTQQSINHPSSSSTTTFIPLGVTKRNAKPDCSEHNYRFTNHYTPAADEAESNSYPPKKEMTSSGNNSLVASKIEIPSFPQNKYHINNPQYQKQQNQTVLVEDYSKMKNSTSQFPNNNLMTPEQLLCN